MLYTVKNDIQIDIREARTEEWDTAMELAFLVFLKYESHEYGTAGTEEFARFVTDDRLKKLFLSGSYRLLVAIHNDEIIGLISLRSGNHLSLLFVHKDYHKLGIGSALIREMVTFLKKHSNHNSITVNSAPYACEFYHACGFVDVGEQETREGIVFTPMELCW